MEFFLMRTQPLAPYYQLLCSLICAAMIVSADVATADHLPRVTQGLLALYTFEENAGTDIRDQSSNGEQLDLTIDDSRGIHWNEDSLMIRSSTTIRSKKPPTTIVNRIQKSKSLTIETWLTPANTSQSGPARIVSLSANPSQRNLTIGQEKDTYDVRLRTSKRDQNGMPSTSTPKDTAQRKLSHVVFTRSPQGAAAIYVDGKEVTRQNIPGDFGNWDNNFSLVIANEATGDRPWLGELHLVAIYDRALPAEEVRQNFQAGPQLSQPEPPTPEMLSAQKFETEIAPLLTRHCLECHDSAIRKGDLDLSKRVAALKGGESGHAIEPGHSDDSLLWQLVNSNDMPKDRAPLSDEEKSVLKDWLDGGAVFSIEQIDPAIYAHGTGETNVWIQRLTRSEYITTVRSAVGVEISEEANQLLPSELRADGFSNTAYNLNVDLKHVEAYARLAEIIVQKMNVLDFAAKFSKSRKLSTDDTMREHVAAMGKRLFRGPLDEREVNAYSGIATTVASAGGDFEQAMTVIVEAMLQSPRFIYRIESQYAGSGKRPVGPYELASRMSYIIWGGPPDEELFRAAESGELGSESHLRSQIARMLKHDQARARSLEFVADWLNLGRLKNMQPNSDRFPNWSPQLAEDMRQESLDFFDEIVWEQNRPLFDLLNAQVTFATPQLAQHYGFEPVGESISRYDLSQIPERGGLLTHASVLTIGGDDASMVSRGLFVLHDLLRGTINAPPPCVNTTPPPAKAGLSQRGIAEQRIADVKCGVCHVRFEPLAFGLEKFDGIGAFHDQDRFGNTLRDDGEILFPGEATPVKYQSSAELMQLLAKSERVRESLTWKVTQFSLGRPLTASDAIEVASIHESAQHAGGTYPSLITAIVLSDLVQMTGTH